MASDVLLLYFSIKVTTDLEISATVVNCQHLRSLVMPWRESNVTSIFDKLGTVL